MWCIPLEQNGQFVARMEQVLDVYARPYDRRRPVVCMDEQPVQLTSETRTPIPAKSGRKTKSDYEYTREGTCVVWMFVEPPGSWRNRGLIVSIGAETAFGAEDEIGCTINMPRMRMVPVTLRRTAMDWACRMKELVDHPRFGNAEKITVVLDNLNTHDLGSLYEAFPPAEAKRIADKLELVFTPKHGSWLPFSESTGRRMRAERVDSPVVVGPSGK